MRRFGDRLLVFGANLAWLLLCLPGFGRLLFEALSVRRTQARVLRGILRANRKTDFGRRFGFDTIRTPEQFRRLPLTGYDDYRGDIAAIRKGEAGRLTAEPVICLAPTSGSTDATKLIPYTSTLLRQFRAGIDPWIAHLYLGRPRLLFGRQYWSISPNTALAGEPGDIVRVGFADDAEYLGRCQQRLAASLFVVPPQIARVEDPRDFELLTCLFLLRERNLRLISVWHPSFLTILMKVVRERFAELTEAIERGVIPQGVDLPDDLHEVLTGWLRPDSRRAAELRSFDASRGDLGCVWPAVAVISCWAGGRTKPWLHEIHSMFPHAAIQPKGLLATEAIMSVPVGPRGLPTLAIGSHFFEFIDGQTRQMRLAWQLVSGREYEVVVTTGGGLYRYQLHDLIRVEEFFCGVPCVSFVSRTGAFSDLVGEKLDSPQVQKAIGRVESETGVPLGFAMLAPTLSDGVGRYVLYVQVLDEQDFDSARAASVLETDLCRNYHYRHARRLGQLQPVVVQLVGENAERRYVDRFAAKGIRRGDIKLACLRPETDWDEVFAPTFGIQPSRSNDT